MLRKRSLAAAVVAGLAFPSVALAGHRHGHHGGWGGHGGGWGGHGGGWGGHGGGGGGHGGGGH